LASTTPGVFALGASPFIILLEAWVMVSTPTGNPHTLLADRQTVLPVLLGATLVLSPDEKLPVIRDISTCFISHPILIILTMAIPLTPYRVASLANIRRSLWFEHGRYERSENEDDLELQAASMTCDIKITPFCF
jgi:hypothetical protein